MTRRVLVTDAEDFVGPAAVERFRAGGDTVVAHAAPLGARADVADLVADDGPFDVVIANLDAPITVAPITDHNDDITDRLFERLVNPLFWLLEECLPSRYAAGQGAIVVPTSATAIRSSSHPIAGYEVARAAQMQLVRSAGKEAAAHGVGVNGIAPKTSSRTLPASHQRPSKIPYSKTRCGVRCQHSAWVEVRKPPQPCVGWRRTMRRTSSANHPYRRRLDPLATAAQRCV